MGRYNVCKSVDEDLGSVQTCHYYVSSDCAHVSINEVACYLTERTLMGCADPLRRGVHRPPISVLELTNNEVVGGSRH